MINDHFIEDFVRLQIQLVSALIKTFPIFVEDRFMQGIPKRGMLEIDGSTWEFRKHGVGVRFRDISSGKIIDAHKQLDIPEAIDAWRLLQYLESIGLYSYSESEIQADLMNRCERGEIALTDTEGVYRGRNA